MMTEQQIPYLDGDLLHTYLEKQDKAGLREYLKPIHSADIAEISQNFYPEEIITILGLVSHGKSANILSELDKDIQKEVIDLMTPEDIAHAIEEMDTDDAADILAEVDESKKDEIFAHIHDKEHIEDIQELSVYAEDTAGSLMAKEYVEVKEDWSIEECLREVRRQAQEVDRVHSVYLVDSTGKLTGRVSLKDLISADGDKKLSEIKRKRVDSVYDTDHARDVALTMEKYNMEAIPVIRHDGTLLGRITIDDVIDYVRDTAEENYNLASGITQDIDADDGMKDMVKARFPWLFIALVGGFFAVVALGGFEDAMESHGALFFFTPLIAAMAGNVGVQASALVVQGLANGSLKGAIGSRFVREILLSLINGITLSAILFVGSYLIFGFDILVLTTVSIALILVIVMAGLIGTFIPLVLNKAGINPALATGPFITTSNDIFGILIYFSLAKLIIGF